MPSQIYLIHKFLRPLCDVYNPIHGVHGKFIWCPAVRFASELTDFILIQLFGVLTAATFWTLAMFTLGFIIHASWECSICVYRDTFLSIKKTSATHSRQADERTHYGYSSCNFIGSKRKQDFARFPNLNTKHVLGFKETLHWNSQCFLHLIERSSQECIHWFLSF